MWRQPTEQRVLYQYILAIIFFLHLIGAQPLVSQTRPKEKRGPLHFSGDRFLYSQVKKPEPGNPHAVVEIVEIIGNAFVRQDDISIRAYRIKVVGRQMDEAYAYGGVQIRNAKERTVLRGGYGEYFQYADQDPRESYARITRNPWLHYQRAAEKGAKDPDAREGYSLIIHGTEFRRFQKSKVVHVTGKVTFQKSNEQLQGEAKQVWFQEMDEQLTLEKDSVIKRGDDTYRAEWIHYFVQKKVLLMQEKVHLTLYDYNLDPLDPGYRDPFLSAGQGSRQKKSVAPSDSEKGENSSDSPFRLRRYAVAERYLKNGSSWEKLLRMRRFQESRIDIYGDMVHYSQEDEEKNFIEITGNGFYRMHDGFFMADYLYARGSGHRWLAGRGNVFAQNFQEGSIVFANRFSYDRMQQWGRFQNKAYLILVQKKERQFPQRLVWATHLRSDEIERFFVEKVSYLKGKVVVQQWGRRFTGHYAVYKEQEKLLWIPGAPLASDGDSYLEAGFMQYRLDTQIMELQNALRANVISPKGEVNWPVPMSVEQIERILGMQDDIRIRDGWQAQE